MSPCPQHVGYLIMPAMRAERKSDFSEFMNGTIKLLQGLIIWEAGGFSCIFHRKQHQNCIASWFFWGGMFGIWCGKVFIVNPFCKKKPILHTEWEYWLLMLHWWQWRWTFSSPSHYNLCVEDGDIAHFRTSFISLELFIN